VSAIHDSKILASSLVRRRPAITSAFFFSACATSPFPRGAFRLVRVSDTEIRGGVRAQKVSRWRRMTGTHAYSLIGHASCAVSLPARTRRSIPRRQKQNPRDDSRKSNDLWLQRSPRENRMMIHSRDPSFSNIKKTIMTVCCKEAEDVCEDPQGWH
jgi:hypothetical protein